MNITFEIVSSSYDSIDNIINYFKNLINILENIKYNFILVSIPMYKLLIESNNKSEIEQLYKKINNFLIKDTDKIRINNLKIDKIFK